MENWIVLSWVIIKYNLSNKERSFNIILITWYKLQSCLKSVGKYNVVLFMCVICACSYLAAVTVHYKHKLHPPGPILCHSHSIKHPFKCKGNCWNNSLDTVRFLIAWVVPLGCQIVIGQFLTWLYVWALLVWWHTTECSTTIFFIKQNQIKHKNLLLDNYGIMEVKVMMTFFEFLRVCFQYCKGIFFIKKT
jgi:hypothetical protein